MGGRRGNVPWLFEAIFSLVFIAMFAYISVYYITAHSNGESYFAKYYAIDLATTAELVNAGPGDVSLRYSNLKPDLDLRFDFDQGKVAVGGSKDAKDTKIQDAIRTYGLAKDYPLGPTSFTKPEFLMFSKNKNTFTITNIAADISSCPVVVKRKVEFDDAKIFLSITGSDEGYEKKARDAFSAIIPKLADSEQSANIKIIITEKDGEDTILMEPTNNDGATIACYFKSQLLAISAKKYEMQEPQATSQDFALKMDIVTNGYLPPEQLGTALAASFAAYFKGTVINAGKQDNQQNSQQNTPTPSNSNLLLVGDSLTVGYSKQITCSNAPAVYAKEGRKASEMTDLKSYLSSKPGTVVIWAGTNDFFATSDSADKVKARLIAMRDEVKAQSPQSNVYLVTLPPIAAYPSTTPQIQKKFDELNAWIKTQNHIDANRIMDDNSDGITDDKADGLHTTPAGYKKIAQEVQRTVGGGVCK